MPENKAKIEKRNRLKKFLAVLRRRRSNNKSNEEMYFDMGPYSGNESRALDPNSGGETRTEYKDQGTQVMELWNDMETSSHKTLRTSNV